MKNTSLIVLLVSQVVAAIVGLLVAFGVNLSAEQMAAIMTAAGTIGGLVALALWATTVDRAKVVERLIGDHVVAGEANDLVPTGATVREVEPRRAAEGKL